MPNKQEPQPDSVAPDANESGKRIALNELRSVKLPFAIIIALTLLSGVVHGIMDGRWADATDSVARGNQLNRVPETIGDWTLVESKELAGNASKILRCHGSIVRDYRHEPTGSSITVAVLFGPRGPIAVHTPEVCYSSVGVKQLEDRKVEAIRNDESEDKFWSVKFWREADQSVSLEVWYGWSDGGAWVASKQPRFWMTDSLYKIQIATSDFNEDFSPCKDFLTKLLPELEALIQ